MLKRTRAAGQSPANRTIRLGHTREQQDRADREGRARDTEAAKRRPDLVERLRAERGPFFSAVMEAAPGSLACDVGADEEFDGRLRRAGGVQSPAVKEMMPDSALSVFEVYLAREDDTEPLLRELEKGAGLSRKTVLRGKRWLVDNGYIEPMSGGGMRILKSL